jgi:hypothetical protein
VAATDSGAGSADAVSPAEALANPNKLNNSPTVEKTDFRCMD